jgi:hypothetical protein
MYKRVRADVDACRGSLHTLEEGSCTVLPLEGWPVCGGAGKVYEGGGATEDTGFSDCIGSFRSCNWSLEDSGLAQDFSSDHGSF